MGALTSKLYTYKARPWEVKSVDTISLANDPFLPSVKIDLLNRKIMRLLPIISTEEWISDNARFFIRKPFLKTPLAKISYTPNFFFENLNVSSNYNIYEKINIKSAIMLLVNEINTKKNLTILSNEFVDATVFAVVRKMEGLKQYYNLTFTNSQITTPVINSYDTFSYETQLLCFPKEHNELKAIFSTKLMNYKQAISTDLSCFHFNKYTLIGLIEGNLYSPFVIKFITNGIYNKSIPLTFNKIIIDKTNQALFLNTITKPQLKKKNQLILNLGEDIIINQDKNIFSLNYRYTNANILLPTSMPINSNNIYIDLFGKQKKSYTLLLDKNIKPLKNLLAYLIYKLYKNIKNKTI